ncbi:MAG: hypothetical protein JWR09_488 [Mucilaginibacter sp.]|nr:hypothetical protein [Mucilaginibacter sp.]
MNLIDLKEKYKLTSEKFQQIQEQIIDIYTRSITPTDTPTSIILGGQPGSGKGELITIAQKMIHDNLVICNADDFRDFHPDSDEIKSLYEIDYPEITVTYSQSWNDGLRTYCESNRLSYVMETTFTSRERMNDTIREIKGKRYNIILLLLAVNERFSVLGTYLRYEEMKFVSGYGRRVSKKIHDEKYKLVPETLRVVQEAKLYDQLFIYGRKHVEENHLNAGIELIAANPVNPLLIYLEERDKSWSFHTKKYFTECCLKIAKMMNNRKDKFRKEEFLRNVGLTDKL